MRVRSLATNAQQSCTVRLNVHAEILITKRLEKTGIKTSSCKTVLRNYSD